MNPRYLIAVCVLLVATAKAQAPDRVRIAVAGLFHSDQFAVETLPSSPVIFRAGKQKMVIGNSTVQRLVITRVGRKLSFRANEANVTVPSVTVEGKTGDAEFILSVPGRFRRRYRGTLTITPEGNELVPVVSMDIETAVASVVAAEAMSSTPLDALKAIAVSARSYLVAGKPRHRHADFCDTTHCQFLRNPPAPGSPASRAAAETRGMVLLFSGKPFSAMYSASCGGRTHTLADLGLPPSGYPYYAVECDYCRRHPDKWSARIAQSEAEAVAKGERQRIQLARKLGWSVVPSNNFESQQVEAGVLLSGVGHGHGLGLCERGAAAMARDGSDFRTILSHYFPNSIVDFFER